MSVPRATSPAAIVHDDLLADALGDRLREQTCNEIRARTSGKRHDETHRTVELPGGERDAIG
jgi:hypothetical protein